MGKDYKNCDTSQIGSLNWKQILMLTSSVIPRIYVPILLSTIWTAMLTLLYNFIKDKSYVNYFFFPTSLLNYLGFLLSLLLIFRNNSAYDRYWEGRKLWSNIINHSRSLSRHIWIGFEIEEDDPEKEKKVNLKIGALRLIVGLVVSIKHYLRNENRLDYNDLVNTIKHLPRFNTIITEEKDQSVKNLPLKIAYYIESFCFMYLQKTIVLVGGNIQNIISCYTSCQRVIDTPIPIIYRIHLKHVIIIYVITLPLQIISFCGWISTLIVMLTSFTLFGIEAISCEIENPFGYDENDLLLDNFCQQIQSEIDDLMKYYKPSGNDNINWLECKEINDNSKDSEYVNNKKDKNKNNNENENVYVIINSKVIDDDINVNGNNKTK